MLGVADRRAFVDTVEAHLGLPRVTSLPQENHAVACMRVISEVLTRSVFDRDGVFTDWRATAASGQVDSRAT